MAMAIATPASANELKSLSVSSEHFDIILHNDYTAVYSDVESGAKMNLLALNPKTQSGYYMLGSVALDGKDGSIENALKAYRDNDEIAVDKVFPSYDYLPLAMTLKPKQGSENLLAKPTGWVSVWDDAKSGGTYDGTFFRAECPSGYSALGGMIAAQRTASASDFPQFRCVSDAILTEAAWNAEPVWNDKGSGATKNGSLYTISTTGAKSEKDVLMVAPIVATASDNYHAPRSSLGRPMLIKLHLKDKPTSKVIESKAKTADGEPTFKTSARGLPVFTADYQAQYDAFDDQGTEISHSVPWQYVNDPKMSRLDQWAEEPEYEMIETVKWEKLGSFDTLGDRCQNTSQLGEKSLSEASTTGSETNWNNSVGTEIGVTAEAAFKPLGVGGSLAVSVAVNYSHDFGGNVTESLQLSQTGTYPERMGGFAAYFKRTSHYALYRVENGDRELLKEGANGVFDHGFAEVFYAPEGRTDDNPCATAAPQEPDTVLAAAPASDNGMSDAMAMERDYDTEEPEIVLSSDDGKHEYHLIDAGHTLRKGQKHVSRSGDHYLQFEKGGGDLKVYAFEQGGDYVVWSMRDQIARTGHVDKVVYQHDGNRAAYDTNGNYMWSALHEMQPKGTALHLRDDGELQIVHPDGTVAWSSTGNTTAGTD